MRIAIIILMLTMVSAMIIGCTNNLNNPASTGISSDANGSATTATAATACDKIDDCCKIDTDCKYVWYTGYCHTPEYVARVQEEAQKQGLNIGEAPARENVTCTCENEACVTHG